MREHRLSYHEALDRVRQGRQCISPNSGFTEQLQIWKDCEYDIINDEGKEKLAYVQWKAEMATRRKERYNLRNNKQSLPS